MVAREPCGKKRLESFWTYIPEQNFHTFSWSFRKHSSFCLCHLNSRSVETHRFLASHPHRASKHRKNGLDYNAVCFFILFHRSNILLLIPGLPVSPVSPRSAQSFSEQFVCLSHYMYQPHQGDKRLQKLSGNGDWILGTSCYALYREWCSILYKKKH